MEELDLNLLAVFDALFRERSVTRAAHALGMTQSATSHAVNRLRAFFDDPLFVKTKEGMSPTRKAESLRASVLDVMATVRASQAALPHLEAAARTCSALRMPVRHTVAHHHLGLAREALGDTAGAGVDRGGRDGLHGIHDQQRWPDLCDVREHLFEPFAGSAKPEGNGLGLAIYRELMRAHGGDAIGNLLAEQHAAATRLGALPHHHFDGVGLAQVIGVHAVAGGQILVDEVLGLAALFRRHARGLRESRGGHEQGQRGSGGDFREGHGRILRLSRMPG